MIQKRLNEIQETDLQALVDNSVREGNQIEYKLILPTRSDADKKEFLKDVVAFANSSGGDLIYGIRENRTTPEDSATAEEIVGLTGLNVDETKRWMFQVLQTCVEPALQGVEIHDVALSNGAVVLILRAPRSWNAPHLVRFNNHRRFWGRNSAGVYEMDITELRDAFLLSDSITQKLDIFKEQRLQIIRDEIPASVHRFAREQNTTYTVPNAVFVLHMQPFDSVRVNTFLDIVEAKRGNADNLRLGRSININGEVIRYNFDGVLISMQPHSKSYLQIFRSGSTEEVDDKLLNSVNDDRAIDATELGWALVRGVGRRLSLFRNLGITSPVMIHLSLLNVKDFRLKIRLTQGHGERERVSRYLIDKDHLILRGLVVENIQQLNLDRNDTNLPFGQGQDEAWNTIVNLVRPILDTVWQAVSYECCLNYDEQGQWRDNIDPHLL